MNARISWGQMEQLAQIKRLFEESELASGDSEVY